jgi:glycogen(starch) synthase
MKILILNHEYPPIGGGGGNACQHIVRDLAAMGLEVTLVTSAFGDLPAHAREDGASIYRVPAFRTREAESTTAGILAYTLNAALRVVRIERPDLVHAFFGVPAGLVAYGLKAVSRVPYVVSFRGKDVHGGQAREMGGITGALKAVSMPVWRNANALVANSQGLHDIALRVDPDARIEVIPNGIDTDRFYPADSHPEGKIRILYVGRLEPFKGIETLLSALARIASTERIQLQLVGDGSLRADLERKVADLGLSEAVTFQGWVDREAVPKCYRRADLFVMPSLVEGMPNGVLEAMASGLPVIASRVPGTEEIVQDGHNGLLFEPTSVDGLADALKRAIEDHDLRRRLGTEARRVSHERSWEHVARRYASVYDRILSIRHLRPMRSTEHLANNTRPGGQGAPQPRNSRPSSREGSTPVTEPGPASG